MKILSDIALMVIEHEEIILEWEPETGPGIREAVKNVRNYLEESGFDLEAFAGINPKSFPVMHPDAQP